LRRDPASLLYLNAEDPLLLQLEMLRLLELGYEPAEIGRAFGLESEADLHDMLAYVRAEGASALASRRKGKPATASDSFWGDDTMGHICAASVQVFYERGYHGATMRDIAGVVGIRAPSIYNHFPTKEALLHHVMTETLAVLREQLEVALAYTPDDPITRMSTFIREHIRFHLEHAPEAAVADHELGALSEENRASVVAQRDEYEAILRELLQEGMEKGVFAETEVRLVSIAVLTMCTAVATWYRPRGPLSPEEVAAAYTRFVLRMIGCVE
jgi:AcrR family transcriptional regulator